VSIRLKYLHSKCMEIILLRLDLLRGESTVKANISLLVDSLMIKNWHIYWAYYLATLNILSVRISKVLVNDNFSVLWPKCSDLLGIKPSACLNTLTRFVTWNIRCPSFRSERWWDCNFANFWAFSISSQNEKIMMLKKIMLILYCDSFLFGDKLNKQMV
jgi:hypothetical protein